ncbi:MAG: Co2+/Mg2+ efflux protein ApaG [Pseudomonadota bacterium]
MHDPQGETIIVEVATQYIENQSDPDTERYAFAYTITITNRGVAPAQLKNRHWIITDAQGEIEEVRGEGVVGQQPRLQPGEAFQYTSGAILRTPVGAMQGSYEFVDDAGAAFDVPIPAFSLSLPNLVH